MNNGVEGILAELADTSAAKRDRPDRGERARAYVRAQVDAFSRRRPGAAELIERVPRDGYRQDRIELEVLPGVRFAAYVLVPDQARGRIPAVLAVHGHGYGSRQVVGLLPDESLDPTWRDGHHHYAVELARRGLIVMAPEVVGFGDRITDADRAFDADAGNACYRLSQRLLLHGRTLAGLRVAELLGVVDHLTDRQDVDPDRLGIMGHSGGAMVSVLAAAVDDRIGAVVLSSYPNTFAASIGAVRHCACNYLPGVLDVAEQPDLLALVAPRPLFMESGRDDPIFPAEGFEQAVAQLRAVYAEHGASDALEADLVPGGHAVNGRRAYDWLRDRLTTR